MAVSAYTFVSLLSDAKIVEKPDMSYGERYSASLRGWSTSLGFFALGDFVATSALYQSHGHLVDWELAPLLVTWPLVLMELLMLAVVGVILALLTPFIVSRVRIPWLAVGLVLFALGAWHGAIVPVKPL